MAAKEPNNIDDGIAEPGIEPGASAETMLVTTDSFEEYEQEMSNSIDDRQMKESTTSTISEIQEDVQDIPITPTASNPQELQKTTSLDDSELVCFITSFFKHYFIKMYFNLKKIFKNQFKYRIRIIRIVF